MCIIIIKSIIIQLIMGNSVNPHITIFQSFSPNLLNIQNLSLASLLVFKSDYRAFDINWVFIWSPHLAPLTPTSGRCNNDQASANDRWGALVEQMMEHYFQFSCPGFPRRSGNCNLCPDCRAIFCKSAAKGQMLFEVSVCTDWTTRRRMYHKTL